MTAITLYQAMVVKQRAVKLCIDEDGVRDLKRFDAVKGQLRAHTLATTAITKVWGINRARSARLCLAMDESVEIDALTNFSASMCLAPKGLAPDKAKIKAAILAGEPVAGARIVRKVRLAIK
jgi:hypothetical protein